LAHLSPNPSYALIKPISPATLSILKSLTLAIIALFLALAPQTLAEEAYPLKPLLWKVEGNDLTRPSYLFGTIHIGKPPVCNLHPAAQQAFDSAESLYTEISADDAALKSLSPLTKRTDGKTLNESLGKDRCNSVYEELKAINPAVTTKPFQNLSTWYLATTMPLLSYQVVRFKPLDLILWDRATEAGKKTAGLETPNGHLKSFTDLTETEQLILLDGVVDGLKRARKEGKNPIKELICAYVSGDTAKMAALTDKEMQDIVNTEHKEFREKLMKHLLTDRDRLMAVTISGVLKKEPGTTHFFAVGAGHLCREYSIRSHLEREGFKITRVEK